MDLTATAISTTQSEVVICEYCSKEGHPRSECWIFLATQFYCGKCKESRHTIFKNFSKARAFRAGKPGPGRRESKKKGQGSTTILSTAMKTDSTYPVSSAIPIHTTTGIKTGILDSGSGATLIKKTVAEEIPGLPPGQPATKLIEGSTQAICIWKQIRAIIRRYQLTFMTRRSNRCDSWNRLRPTRTSSDGLDDGRLENVLDPRTC